MSTYTSGTRKGESKAIADEAPQKQNGNISAFQFQDNRSALHEQRKLHEMAQSSQRVKQLSAYFQPTAIALSSLQQQPPKKTESRTDLPGSLKAGIESLSGYSMDDVAVHYNSARPAQLNAHAYAQGSDIYVASGQEKHLPHEAWHIVQQKQGRVKPTIQTKDGSKINNDTGLEKEADVMGNRARQHTVRRRKSDLMDSQPKSRDHTVMTRINDEISEGTIQPGTMPVIAQRIEIAQSAGNTLIVDDTEAVREGQIGKMQFLSYMEAQLRILSKQILEPVGLSQADCPDLNYWINYYADKNAAFIERAMKRYASLAAGAATWTDFAAAIILRVKQGLIENIRTGSSEVDPEPAPETLKKERPRWSEVTQRVEAPLQFKICGKGEAPEAKRENPFSATLFTDQTYTMVRGVDKPVCVVGMMTCGAGIAISQNYVFVHHIPSGDTDAFIREINAAAIGTIEKIVMMISNSSLDLESLKRSFVPDVRKIRQQATNVEILYITGGNVKVNNDGGYDVRGGTTILGSETYP